MLIGRVGIGVDEEHADCLATGSQQGLGLVAYLVEVDRGVNAAIGQHPLVNLQAQGAGHDGFKTAAQAPGLWPVASAHFQHITKAARGDDARASHLAL